jgi:hypothetical protein
MYSNKDCSKKHFNALKSTTTITKRCNINSYEFLFVMLSEVGRRPRDRLNKFLTLSSFSRREG